MTNYQIITNNPAVSAVYGAVARYIGGTVDAVFGAVRDAVHLGATLISHPLAGSVKPNESPYKSVVLSTRRGEVDTASLMLIEDAIAVLRKLPAKDRRYSEGVLDDFSVIDLDLMRSAMEALPAGFYSHTSEKEEAHHVNGL